MSVEPGGLSDTAVRSFTLPTCQEDRTVAFLFSMNSFASIPQYILDELASPDSVTYRTVSSAVANYTTVFQDTVKKNGGYDRPIELPVPHDDYEAAALTLFMLEISKIIPPEAIVRLAPDNDNA